MGSVKAILMAAVILCFVLTAFMIAKIVGWFSVDARAESQY